MHCSWARWSCILAVLVGLYTPATALVWQDVARELMSPACPGRTLINCTSAQAEQWRELIRQKIARGETKEQILQYFIGIRGEEILAAPPKRGFALTAWLLPLFVMINGAGLIIVLTLRWSRRRSDTQVNQEQELPPPPQSDPYWDRLQRELQDFSS